VATKANVHDILSRLLLLLLLLLPLLCKFWRRCSMLGFQ